MRIITVKRASRMRKYIRQVWAIMCASYARVDGGWHYATPEQLLEDSACWRVVLHGGRVAAATVYKVKKGLKLVAMGTCSELKDAARQGLQKIVRADLTRCWMELSEAAENFVMKYCNGDRYIIHGSLVAGLLEKDIEPTQDGYHYRRMVCGIRKCKILVGTPVV